MTRANKIRLCIKYDIKIRKYLLLLVFPFVDACVREFVHSHIFVCYFATHV